MRTIEFRGVTVEYDETCPKKWKWQKAIASGDTGKAVNAIEQLFFGKDDDIAESLGGEFEVMTELVEAIMEEINKGKGKEKN